MANNPLFRVDNSPTRTTRPTKAVNEVKPAVALTHNTFDNSYFVFKTQRYGQYEPFFWKNCVAGDNEPFANSHNVRSLPFASPILSPMKLNKDYFQVPHYAIQPNTWDYIFKAPSQGDDVPLNAQNLFPLYKSQLNWDITQFLESTVQQFVYPFDQDTAPNIVLSLLLLENFFSSGSLIYSMGYKMNPVIVNDGTLKTFDEFFDLVFRSLDMCVRLNVEGDNRAFSTADYSPEFTIVDKWTFVSLLRAFSGSIIDFQVFSDSGVFEQNYELLPSSIWQRSADDDLNYIRMDAINAYQLCCAQYYVNPRVDFIYTAQLYRDNFIQLLRSFSQTIQGVEIALNTFDYNGIPVLYDFFSLEYYNVLFYLLHELYEGAGYLTSLDKWSEALNIIDYLFGYREQLRFGDYLADSRPQALGYGEEGSDVVQVMDDGVSVIDMSEKLVLQRFRSAVAKLDNTAEDYLATMFHEQLPPDYHYPKFIVHSEFGINGDEVSNTTSDNQGNIVTNLKSGEDTSEFNIDIAVPSILIGISYVSIPYVYSQIKERHYMHIDRNDMFQPMLQYFGDQEVYNREVSDEIQHPELPYGYHSRNGEYKQRLSQVSGAFLTSLRSWLFTADLPALDPTRDFGFNLRLSNHQSPTAIRSFDWEFNRFLAKQTGLSLGTGFHFIMQYNNKNVANRPMDVNPLTLYPSSI